jgi:hypothetical protein
VTDIEVIIDDYPIDIVIDDSPIEVVVTGAAGADGATGPPGAAGSHYEHVQVTGSTVWFVDHMLGYRPGIHVLVGDVGSEIDVTDGVTVTHIDENHATVTSGLSISGKAECS